MPTSGISIKNPAIQMSVWSNFASSCEPQSLDASTSRAAMQQVYGLKTCLNAIADGTARYVVTCKEKARRLGYSFANFFHSLRVTNVVLRQRAWIFPRHAIDRGSSDAQNGGVFGFDLSRQQIIRGFVQIAFAAARSKTGHHCGAVSGVRGK